MKKFSTGNKKKQNHSIANNLNESQKNNAGQKSIDNRAEAIAQKRIDAIANKNFNKKNSTGSTVVQRMTGVKVIALNDEEIAANKGLAAKVIELVQLNTGNEPEADKYLLLGRVVYEENSGQYKGTYKDGFATYDFLQNSSELKAAVEAHVDQSLNKSGQYEKLKEGQKTTNDVYYVVDVDYYHKRSLAKAAFHKDSTGTGMYVNLSFLNDNTIIGPEYIADIQGDAVNEGALKSQWYKDELAQWRASPEAQEGAEKIEYGLVPPGGMSVMNDGSVVHSSPSLESRFDAGKLNANHPYASGLYENSVTGKKQPIKKNTKAYRARRLSALLAKSKENGNVDEKKIVEDTESGDRSFIRCEVKEIKR